MSTTVSRSLALALSAWAFAAPAAKAGIFDDCRQRTECRRVSGAELDHLRGGFTFTNGRSPLHVSFGIAQAVVVNDELVAVTQLRLPDLGKMIASFSANAVDLSALANALKSINVQPPATAASGAAVAQQSARAGEAVVAATGAQVSPAAPSSVPGAAEAASALAQSSTAAAARHEPASPAVPGSQLVVNGKALAPGAPVIQVPSTDELRGLIVQNGPANLALPNAADLKAAMTGLVIQNTLNDQTIRALTVINVAVSVKDALSAARIQESVRQSIASSLR